MLLKKTTKLFICAVLAFSCIGSGLTVSAQPAGDHDAEIMQIKGKWSKNPNHDDGNDAVLSSSQFSEVAQKTNRMLDLLKKSYPNPAGVEVFHHVLFNFRPLFTGAPAAYQLVSYFKSYYFNKHLNQILPGSETNTIIRIEVNRFGSLLKDQGECTIDGQPVKVYNLLEAEGEWKGSQLFTEEYWGADPKMGKFKDKAILISRDGKLPYIPITQKQYLLAVRQKKLADRKKFEDMYPARDKQFQKIIEETRRNKYIDAAAKEKLIANYQKQIAINASTSDTELKKLTWQVDRELEIIDQYINSHTETELQQAVITTTPWKFAGNFMEAGQKKKYRLVRVDPSYFKSNLPRSIPQFIVISWSSNKDLPATECIRQFEENFPVANLKSMIDNVAGMVDTKPLFVKTDPQNDPELKAVTKKAQAFADSMLRLKPRVSSKIPVQKDSLTYAIPVRQERWLNTIPEKTMKPFELKIYLSKIDQKYTDVLLASNTKLPDISVASLGEISYTANLLLLQGKGELAAWMAIKAVQKAPGNTTILNNAGAVLNGCGFQPVAVPILETALQKDPGNSTIQNNLGQAYIALGNTAKAIQYLQQSVAKSPYHPYANYSLARIYYSKGDKVNAIKYVENSLRGSFNDQAWHLLFKLKPEARLKNYMKHRYKAPEYFNEDKYHLPEQCEKVSDIGILKGVYNAYHNMIAKAHKEFKAIEDEENEKGIKSVLDRNRNYQTSTIRRTPFTELSGAMLLDLTHWMNDQLDELTRAQHIYRKQIEELNKSYKVIYAATSDCGELLALANRYMELMAFVTREYQKKWLPVYKEYFNDMMYWSSFAMDKHLQRGLYAGAVRSFLNLLQSLAETHFLELTQNCSSQPEIKKTPEDFKIREFNCPIEQDIDLGGGSLYVDCEKIEYHFGIFIPVDIVHTVRDHHTTIAIGAGLDFKFGHERLKAGPIQGGFSGAAKMQYFLSFDGTHPSDQGLIWEGKIKYSQKIDTEIGSGIDDIDEIGTTNIDLSARTVLSVHSGFSSTGSLYKLLDKILEVAPEKQENKNIKIYNQ